MGGGAPISFAKGCYTVTYEAYEVGDSDLHFIVDEVSVWIKNNEIKKTNNLSIEFRYYVIDDSKYNEQINIIKENLGLFNCDNDNVYKPFTDMNKE